MRHMKSSFLATTVVSLLAATAFTGLSAGAASAAAASQPSWCGWTPANNSHDPAWVTGGVNIRTGQGTSCNIKNGAHPTANPGDVLLVHCISSNNWYYLTDESTGVTGWSAAYLVTALFDAGSC